MRYVKAKCEEADKAETYRIYVTDALKIIGNLNLRYAEMIAPPIEETRTAEEIKQSIMDKLSQMGGE